MQFAGLYYVFITAIMYTGGGEVLEKLCPMSSVQDMYRGRTQDLGHSLFPISTY